MSYKYIYGYLSYRKHSLFSPLQITDNMHSTQLARQPASVH